MKKIWINKCKSFKEAHEFDDHYYQSLTPEERLDIVQYLRLNQYKMDTKNARRKRLRRSITIIQQT